LRHPSFFRFTGSTRNVLFEFGREEKKKTLWVAIILTALNTTTLVLAEVAHPPVPVLIDTIALMDLHVEGVLVVEEVAVPSEGPVMILQVTPQYMTKLLLKETWVDITITILGPIRIRSIRTIRTVVMRISSVIQMPLAGMIRATGMEISKVR
jgi:hypothetical protein